MTVCGTQYCNLAVKTTMFWFNPLLGKLDFSQLRHRFSARKRTDSSVSAVKWIVSHLHWIRLTDFIPFTALRSLHLASFPARKRGFKTVPLRHIGCRRMTLRHVTSCWLPARRLHTVGGALISEHPSASVLLKYRIQGWNLSVAAQRQLAVDFCLEKSVVQLN